MPEYVIQVETEELWICGHPIKCGWRGRESKLVPVAKNLGGLKVSQMTCPDCGDKSFRVVNAVKCPHCSGRGWQGTDLEMNGRDECRHCYGTGLTPQNK